MEIPTGFTQNVSVHKCPCGHASCNSYTLSTQDSVGFAEEDARLYALAPQMAAEIRALRDALTRARKYIVEGRDREGPVLRQIEAALASKESR